MMEYTVFIAVEDAFDEDSFVRLNHLTKDEVDMLAEIVVRNNCDMLVRPVRKGK